MAHFFCLAFLLALVSLQVWCQTVQDSWTAPASPDTSTSLQSGNPFTLLWKSDLKYEFSGYCPSCSVDQLDLWVTSFSNDDYNYKIGAGIDLITTLSYDWNVNIPTAALSAESVWVFRFTPFGSTPPFDEQVSSAAVNIIGPEQASSSSTSSSATSSPSSSSSTTASTSTTASASTTPSPAATSIAPEPGPESKAWIAGVVIGPLVGIALGAALMWFLLGKRKGKKAQQDPMNVAYSQDADYPELVSVQRPEGKYHKPDIQPPVYHDQEPVETPGSEPAELWDGRDRS